MRLNRFRKRIAFFLLKRFLIIVSYFNHRSYMRMYIPLLKKNGMNIIGTPRYIGKDVIFDDFNLITLGDRNVISNECHFLTHDYSYTTALISIDELPISDIAIVRPIKIGSNVFIGKKSIIMPNTTIGNNVIIGAGSVVRGNIPDDSVAIGNPAVVVDKTTNVAKKWKDTLKSEILRIDSK